MTDSYIIVKVADDRVADVRKDIHKIEGIPFSTAVVNVYSGRYKTMQPLLESLFRPSVAAEIPEDPTTVQVPIEELEALRTVYIAANHADGLPTEYGCNIQGGWGDCAEIEALLAHLPQPTAPIDGYVRDAGGGAMTIVVDRDTPYYPRIGERARVTFTLDEDDDFGPHEPIGKPRRCGGCGEPWPCKGALQ